MDDEPRPRAIFYGSPDFAISCLDATASLCDVRLVLCQPDRRSGRGMKLRPPPVKVRALELGLEVAQPTRMRDPELAVRLRALEADIAVVVAYGRILPQALLDAPRLGSVNVHASILPRYRGAAPIQWAIVRGETRTGVSLMQMDAGLDTGPVLALRETPIGRDETAGDLSDRLSRLGAELLRDSLPPLLRGELSPQPQNDDQATLAPLLNRDHGRIDWTQPAARIHDQVRGLSPWPGTSTTRGGARLRVHRVQVLHGESREGPPGRVHVEGKGRAIVSCGEGALLLEELQEDGRRRGSVRDFIAGRRLVDGDVLGDSA
ncbi:MAG: methionyl-tRNA formyltransferase [Deltaproteobacteria bacterium]|nr:methionyl-tRNA formyltransferase [Deltaproteobacteria bacterium]